MEIAKKTIPDLISLELNFDYSQDYIREVPLLIQNKVVHNYNNRTKLLPTNTDVISLLSLYSLSSGLFLWLMFTFKNSIYVHDGRQDDVLFKIIIIHICQAIRILNGIHQRYIVDWRVSEGPKIIDSPLEERCGAFAQWPEASQHNKFYSREDYKIQ